MVVKEVFRRVKQLTNIATHEIEESASQAGTPVIEFPSHDHDSDRSVSVHETSKRLKQDLRMGRTYQQGRINWITSLFMGAFHVGAIAALFFFSWKNLIVAAIMYFFAINVGIGMAYHRLLTHRGYKVPRWMEYFLTACGTMALEGGPIFWVATHRVHHQNSDQEGDPHTPKDEGVPGGRMPAGSFRGAHYIPETAAARTLCS